MVRINKVYTKKGDSGKTSLAGGMRVDKTHPRVEAYGTVDELNSLIGVVRCFNLQKEPSDRRGKLEIILQTIQQKLFDIGSLLATPPSDQNKTLELPPEATKWLEDVIDAMNEELEPLRSFILPGGSPVNAFLHVSRTVCRRAERQITALRQQEEITESIPAFVNRLSDALFVMGRWVAATLGEDEFLWLPGQTKIPDWRWFKYGTDDQR